MAATLQNNTPVSGSRTITFAFHEVNAKIDVLADNAAHGLWDKGFGDHGTPGVPKAYAELTTQEKLDVLDAYVTYTLKAESRAYFKKSAVETVGIIAESDAMTTIDLIS